MTKKQYKVSRADLKKVYDVACTSWKERINKLALEVGALEDMIPISSAEIRQMFFASDLDQRVVLQEVFPEYVLDTEGLNPCVTFTSEATGLLRNLCTEVFENPNAIQPARGSVSECSIDRPDLYDRALYVTCRYKVILHELGMGGTVVEFRNK